MSYLDNYEKKVTDFIPKNGADETNENITTKFQRNVRNAVNRCKILINAEDKGRYVSLNPHIPTLKGFLKVRKDGTPIRPIVDSTQAEAYKVAKKLTNTLKTYIPLPNAFNVQNSLQLMRDISEIPLVPELKLASLDISDMY